MIPFFSNAQVTMLDVLFFMVAILWLVLVLLQETINAKIAIPWMLTYCFIFDFY
jgi:hypothetical protein